MLHAVILAGGSGTRLWPASRKQLPKHMLVFEPPHTLLQATLERLGGLVSPEQTWIVTNQSQVNQIADSLPHFDAQHILAEPFSRNTAPSIGWAAAKLRHIDPDATMIVLPADHIIKPASAFCDVLRLAAEIVASSPQQLVTIGIKPTFPVTSYGYIQRGNAVNTAGSAFYALQFCEKPKREIAESFIQSGDYYWNAGIFVWKAERILELLHHFESEIGSALDVITEAIGTDKEALVTEKSFERMKSISIDEAVMEKAKNIIIMDSLFAWNDVGTWTALDRLYADQKDSSGNLSIDSSVLMVDSENCTVRSDDPNHLISLVGLQDITVIHTGDATLIVRKDREDAVRQIVEALKTEQRERWR